ncbi:MAG: hypothetical protein ACP5TL_02505 [Candidatus Micrarchaeia archaeon]
MNSKEDKTDADKYAVRYLSNTRDYMNSKEDKTDADEHQDNVNTNPAQELSIAEPLSFWIGMLLLAIIIELIIVPFASNIGIGSFKNTLNEIAGYIVYLPGSIIIPLLVALWLGERIGVNSKGERVAYRSIINSIYLVFVYVVAIFIIYLIAKFTNVKLFPTILPTLSVASFITFLILVPTVIILVLTPLFAMLSAARHK